MKKIAFLLSSFLFANVQFIMGQKCETKTDPFTNELVSSYEWLSYGIRNLFYESIKGKKTLEFREAEKAGINFTIPKGTEILFKLENGEIIRLFTLTDVRSVVSVAGAAGGSITYTDYFLKAEISDEQLQKFAASKVSDVKYPDLHGGSKNENSGEMNKTFRKSLMEGAKCLLGMK